MEMKGRHIIHLLRTTCLTWCILLACPAADAQPVVKSYTVRDGKMIIELGKQIRAKELEEFINAFDLADLDLITFLKTNNPDSLHKLGWILEKNNDAVFIISKPLYSFDMKGSPADRILFGHPPPAPRTVSGQRPADTHGYNRFRNKNAFAARDSAVTFYLRGYTNHKKVLLAGSFTNWQTGALPMKKTDSGWIAHVQLGPGKYWYKFIADGHWMHDQDNQLVENDGEGNMNSVFYKTNTTFKLEGFTNAKRVYLTGSFNNWQERGLQMQRAAGGWELQLYLPEGTHTYKFLVDGNWHMDAANSDRLPDGHGGYNSVIRIGEPHMFRLNGYRNASQVMLAGSFNGWKPDELLMKKTAQGWELPYVLGSGNYQYKFIVDGEWITDPANPDIGEDGNSFIVIKPNYTFRLKAPQAKKVYLAGDFNNWDPRSLPMKLENGEWVSKVHLAPGKHRYKFVIDGEWKIDPANKLWEENEYGTGNSVLWIE